MEKIEKYANKHLYTDIIPYEVVKVISERCCEVRRMRAEPRELPKIRHDGGFLAHVEDNCSQQYEYKSLPDEPVIRIRFSKAKNRWQCAGGNHYVMNEKPHYFYDYNF